MSNFIKKLKNDQNGSTIIWAVGVIMLLLILMTGTLSFAKLYTNKSYSNVSREQAQQTAQSAVDAVISKFDEPLIYSSGAYVFNDNYADLIQVLFDNRDNYVPIVTQAIDGSGNKVPDTSFNFDNGLAEPKMGNCQVKIKFYQLEYIEGGPIPNPSPTINPYPSGYFPPEDPHHPTNYSGKIEIVATAAYDTGEVEISATLWGCKEREVNGTMIYGYVDYNDANGNSDTADIIPKWILMEYKNN